MAKKKYQTVEKLLVSLKDFYFIQYAMGNHWRILSRTVTQLDL